MAQITDAGYVGKTQNEYFLDERQLYLDIDPNWNLDPSTPDGLKIASDAEVFANLDEAIRQAYNSKDPNKSRGLELDVICALTGTERNPGTPSTVALTISGTPGTVIVAGRLVESTVNGSQWAIDSDLTIGGGGTVAATATCTENGATQANVGDITKIVDTVGGWQSVTNSVVATPGTPPQTDAQLRLERALSVGRPGNNQIDSMLGEVFSVDGVRRARVYENYEATPDGNGQPGHSIAPIVDGGTDSGVAEAIYTKKNPGVSLYQAGTPVSVSVTSPLYPQQITTIKFSRPSYVDILMVIDVVDDGTLPADAEDQIKAAIIEYTNGVLVPAGYGFNLVGFGIGEDVPISRVYTPINSVIGQYGNSYVSNMTLNGLSANVAIAWNELSRWTEGNITVNIT